jgi:hypothetical protein
MGFAFLIPGTPLTRRIPHSMSLYVRLQGRDVARETSSRSSTVVRNSLAHNIPRQNSAELVWESSQHTTHFDRALREYLVMNLKHDENFVLDHPKVKLSWIVWKAKCNG